MENMEIYERYRKVPDEAKKEIAAGRLKGMTDINPMWRIRCLTECFGPCGAGWFPKISDRWVDTGANGEITANVSVDLYIRVDGEWSKPICGVGGSRLVSSEKSGLYTDDECWKKAYTDALSVCCKLLGIGADVYWSKDSSKYTARSAAATQQLSGSFTPKCADCDDDISVKVHDYSAKKYGRPLCMRCQKNVGAKSADVRANDDIIPPPGDEDLPF